MSELIDREAFIEQERKVYCENCDRRQGMKNGKLTFCYEIGDAPCRACWGEDILTDLEDFPAAPRWVRCEERLPDEKCDLLFVLHYDAYHDTGFDEDMPANTKVVYGRFEPTNKRGRRYWTWETESGLQECISNERDEDEYGCITLVTHWMPLPEPPKEDMDGERREG